MSKLPAILLIGYGNSLRGDDAVGPVVAGFVEAWNLANVKVIARQQLTPELADDLVQADIAYFIDASADMTLKQPLVQDVDMLPESTVSHFSSPKTLLTLTRQLYGREPRAYIISVPAQSFDLREGLSAKARCGVEEMLEYLREILVSEKVLQMV